MYQALQAWNCIELSLKDTRALLLDNLSYINDLRRQQSLKVISPNYTLSSKREEVFEDDLSSIIERENATNKLFNKAADNHKKQQQNYKENIPRPTFVKRNPYYGQEAATTMGVTQGHTATTRTQCPIKERANSNNIFILTQSSAEETKQTESVLQMLENLGFRINVPKSNLVPFQQVEYLGFQINSKEISITLSHKKVSELRRDCLTIIRKQPVHIKKLASIIGRLLATTELKAIHYAQLSFETIKDQTIMIKSDNMTAIAYLNQQGGTITQELSLLAEDIWNLCLNWKIKIIAQHLLGKLNIQADWASRQKKRPTPILFLKVFRPISPCNRCIEIGLAQGNAMGKPTMDPYPKNIVQSNTRQSYTLHYNSRVEDGTMVFSINEHSNRFSDITAIIHITSPITNQSTQSLSKPKMEDVCLLNIRTKLQAKKFPEEVIKKIQEATNKSSNATIGSSINKWCIWCYERSMDPIQGPLENIIEFLNDISNQNKAFNTIASYRIAITIHKINPPPFPPDNGLDILPSLDIIVSLSANDSMSILDLSQKAAFLTALGTASRPSDLQKIDLRTLCKSKQGISLEITNSKEVNISIAHGLLDRTQEWRNTPELQEYLFLTSTILHCLATVDTISRWIKHILIQADLAAKTKDIRTISALFAQDAGVDMNTLLALGNWSNYLVYKGSTKGTSEAC
ncbi:22745_t:CDS:2 [Gigaspora margarita]|uniref:22745_t:CDS:1 n=1 Tax=Gigaspora margarita TaxID=4874 RepID=A0ABN7W4J9_GIGMA|nr:22745_t:CDS:2 [Gigaspora margarita]